MGQATRTTDMKHLNANYHATSLGPLFENGAQLRDLGIDQVSAHNESWMEQCLKWAAHHIPNCKREDFTGEDIRFWIQDYVGEPGHPNAFGALINTLIKRKVIVPTGEHRQMKDKTSHARSTPVYKAP